MATKETTSVKKTALQSELLDVLIFQGVAISDICVAV